MNDQEPTISVIISTYNHVEWLKKVLWGYEVQTFKNFELVIADDGSTMETKKLIDQFVRKETLQIKHVWHPDNGFQKTKILNKAILQSASDYLLFSDGDCIPRKDFVETHFRNRKTGYFLSGGYFKLPIVTSKFIIKDTIYAQHVFQKNWLYQNGVSKTFKMMKLTSQGRLEQFLNAFTPTKATWNGHNASGWKKDILKVNGFDERMQYGGEDRELGERMMNLGIKPIQLRYSAICIHLDHERSYKDKTAIDKNNAIRKITLNDKLIWTAYGINKHHGS